MASDTLEHCFERFRRTGDPAALAAVFDQSARELLRLAEHLTRDVHSAEDLVQATFLAAIQHLDALPPGGRVLPWLLGILANRARRLRRERMRVPDPRRLPEKTEPGPDELAMAGEVRSELAARIAELPEPYRPVLTLHLRHGLSAREIAAALERPPGTVRTQIVRALDLLRRALPAGLATAAIGAVTPGRGLAAVRAAVLSHVPAPATVGATAWLSGVLLMSAKAWIVVGAVLVLPALWFWFPGTGSGSQPSQVVVEPAAGQEVPAPRNRDSAPVPATRTAAQVPSTTAESSTGPGSLALHVTWEDDHTPAAGIGVQVRPWRHQGLLDQEATTAADGTARIDGLLPGKVTVAVDRGSTQNVEVRSGATTAVALTIPPGITVTGRVVDKDERAVGGAWIWLSRAQVDDQGQLCAQADGEGRFSLRGVAPGRTVGARARGFLQSALQRIQGAAGTTVTIQLRLLHAGGALVGHVVDPTRRPVPDATVVVGTMLANGQAMFFPGLGLVGVPPLQTRTGPDGGFAVDGVPFDVPLQGRPIDVFIGAPGFAPWHDQVRGPTAEPMEIRVELAPGATVLGRVADPLGQPIAGAMVVAGGAVTAGTKAPGWMRAIMTTGRDGAFRLEGLSAGEVQLYAQGEGGAHVSATVSVAAGDVARWDPVLGGGRTIRGQVLDARGSPLAGWRVGSGPQDGLAARITKTGTDGRFAVTDCDRVSHRLEVHEPGTRGLTPVLILRGIEPDGDPVLLQVSDQSRSTAFVTGTILDPDGKPAAGRGVWLVRVGTLPLLQCPSDRTGAFRFGPLPPARYRLGIRAAAAAPAEELGEHELAPNQTLDLGPIRPAACGRAAVQVRDEQGEPFRGSCFVLDRDGAAVGSIALPHGSGTSQPLRPGEYFLAAPWSGRDVPCRVPFQIAAGQDTQVVLTVRRGGVRKFRLAGELGARKGVRLTWLTAHGQVVWVETMALGSTGERGFAPGSYRVEAVADDGRRRTTEFTVSEAPTATGEILIQCP